MKKTIRIPGKHQRAKTYLERQNEVPLWQRLSPWHRRMSVKTLECDENGHRIVAWMKGQGDNKNGKAMTLRSTEAMCSTLPPSPLRRNFSFVGMPSTPSKELQRRPSSTTPVMAEMPDTAIFEMMDTSPRVELEDTGIGSETLGNPVNPYGIAGWGSIGLSSAVNNSRAAYQVSEFSSSFPAVANSHTAYQVSEISDSLAAEAPPPRSPLVETHHQPAPQVSRHVLFNIVEKDETKQSGLSIPIPEPNPVLLRQKGPCLYPPPHNIFIRRRARVYSPSRSLNSGTVSRSDSLTWQVKETSSAQKKEDRPRSPNHVLGYKPWHAAQNVDIEEKQRPQGDSMALWSSLRPSSQTTRKLQKLKRVQSRQKPGCISNIGARLKSVVHKNDSEFGGPVANRVHRHGLVYEYLGPTAVTGPYTEQDEPPQSPHQSAGGVPMLPDIPENIRMPVELDSQQTRAIPDA
ncbi:hypothetical protein PFICI_12326 [Pestalotiopsis fici W106-1]|uniref:Uncharacterized protein n=1 Tax=Pestalotiopsis fici (strain W106-1 / CGMCC3.15140) TaxID=1229662 RepID=W3WQG4_PESFW|nr:uncharacterized protein PFICI_12326 [Pestalotiopsis fici W106-1]ETS75382.1 hypothetical protein PFICI_12326 [Pestalotiopsis fici W106-1]